MTNAAPVVFDEKLLAFAFEAAREDVYLRQWLDYQLSEGFHALFEPRPDDVVNYDQQESFVFNQDQVAMLVGGNAAGTTEAAAAKTGKFLTLWQPPPRRDTPFWIIANTYDQVCDVCWTEKLVGHGHIPECEIQWDRIAWHSLKQNRPKTVPLKPWRGKNGDPNKNWLLEFKTYSQGREALQARSIGGFWFSEQFPLDVFLEVLRGCREYMFPGGQFAEFTPIDPELSLWVERVMENPPKGWKFYRANTMKNVRNLDAGWADQFFSLVPDELKATRQTGQLASFEGIIYPSFDLNIHVRDERDVKVPRGAYHATATDWGASAEHPFAGVFGCRDTLGNWLIYDEYHCNDQNQTNLDHANSFLDILARWGWPIVIVRDAAGEPLKHPDGSVVRRMNPARDALWGCNHGDPARPDMIREFGILGIDTMPARNAVYDGINCVRTALHCHSVTREPGLIISSRCENLIREIRKYRWLRGKKANTGNVVNPAVARPVPLKREDDTIDAVRYLLFSNALSLTETISSTHQGPAARERKSIQLTQSRIARAIGNGNSVPGLIPPRSR